VQSAQVVLAWHGSVIVVPQLDGVYAHRVHVPIVGPLWLPGLHSESSSQ
jgi:hypothetical protein